MLEPGCSCSTCWNVSFILASPSLLIIQNDSVMKVVRYRAAWCCDVQLSPTLSIGGLGKEGGRTLPSRTYIKDGLWTGISASSHAKLFVDLNAFGLSAHLASVCSDCHELQTVKRSWFVLSPLLQDVLSPFFPRWSPRKWHHIHKHQKRKTQGLPLGRQKSFNFFLTNRFSLHEILIKMDCLRPGWVQRGICIPEPPSARPLFHLGNSTSWLLSTREYLWWRCPTLSFCLCCQTDVGIWVANLKGLACSSGVKGSANYIDKHAWDSSSVRQPFQQRKLWVSQTEHEYSFFFFFFFY